MVQNQVKQYIKDYNKSKGNIFVFESIFSKTNKALTSKSII